MFNDKLARILTEIARQKASHILSNPNWQSDKAAILQIATRLAHNDCLVLLGYVPPSYRQQTSVLSQQWSDNFLRFYDLFAHNLFRTLKYREIRLERHDAYQIALLVGDARDLIITMANYLIPYLDVRASGMVSTDDSHIQIVLREMLADLGGQHINATTYEHLMVEGSKIIQAMVSQPIRQKSLTTFKKPIIYAKPRPSTPPPPTTGNYNGAPQQTTQNQTNSFQSQPDKNSAEPPDTGQNVDYSLPTFEDDKSDSTVMTEDDTEQSTQQIAFKLIPDAPGKTGPGRKLPRYLQRKKRKDDDEERNV